jgi:hypothetical protein
MKRIATANREIDKFGAGKDGFKAAVAGVSDATYLSALFMNHVQEALARTREAAGIAVPADGDFDWMVSALRSGALVYGIDTGAANACVVAFTPAIAAPIDGMALWFKAKSTNTGAATLNAAPVVGAAHSALQGGEIVANGRCQVIWNGTLNAWVLIECTGGALQVAAATQPGHAVNLGQLVAVLAASGYVKIPVSVAGVQRTLIIQWVAPTVPASSSLVVTLPTPWPTGCLVAVPGSMVGGMTAAYTPGCAADVGLTTVGVQNTYSGSAIKIGVLMIGL